MEAKVLEPRVGPMRPSGRAATIIYDGRCPACTGFSKIVGLLDIRHRAQLVPAEDPRALGFVPGETAEDLRKSFHFVTPEGQVLQTGEALLGVLSLLPGLPLGVRAFERLPDHRVLANRFYGWLSRNRRWISLLLRA